MCFLFIIIEDVKLCDGLLVLSWLLSCCAFGLYN